jgi:hypothetical protein
MPYVMRFMADIAPQRFGSIAEGLGIRFRPVQAERHLDCLRGLQNFLRLLDDWLTVHQVHREFELTCSHTQTTRLAKRMRWKNLPHRRSSSSQKKIQRLMFQQRNEELQISHRPIHNI